MKKRSVFLLMVVLMIAVNGVFTQVQAQVKIGGDPDIAPVRGSLLDLNPSATEDASGGLSLPRVHLTSLTTLQPLRAAGQTEPGHVGLEVYNTTDNADFHPGMYVWTGEKWKSSGDESSGSIYLPSFNLKWPQTTSDTICNVFNVYQANFASTALHRVVSAGASLTSVPEFNETVSATDFYYVVTDYDNTAISISSISDAGVITYRKVGSSPIPPENAFVNIILIRKKN
ncbi:MAG: hypothetical protein LBV57_01400 [Candidatus Symbiothrix sp.]|jgi:hypothetical protein|nr:hypothetical protein [Candidatus Symbiothrix sp.]